MHTLSSDVHRVFSRAGRRVPLTALLAAVLLSSCSQPAPTTVAPGYTLILTQDTFNVTGQTVRVPLLTQTIGNFKGTLTLGLQGDADGLTVSPGALDVNATNTTATLTLTASPLAARTTRNLSLVATSGTLRRSVALTVALLDTNFTFTADVSNVNLAAGGTAIVPFTVGGMNGGSPGAVTVTASKLPTGVTATTATVPNGGGSGVLVLNAAGDAPGGTATVSLSAADTVGHSRTATVTLEVQSSTPTIPRVGLNPNPVTVQAGSGNVSVTVTFTRPSDLSGDLTLTAVDVPDDIKWYTSSPLPWATLNVVPADSSSFSLVLSLNSRATNANEGITAAPLQFKLTPTGGTGRMFAVPASLVRDYRAALTSVSCNTRLTTGSRLVLQGRNLSAFTGVSVNGQAVQGYNVTYRSDMQLTMDFPGGYTTSGTLVLSGPNGNASAAFPGCVQ